VVDEQAQAPGTRETGPDEPPALDAAGVVADEAGEVTDVSDVSDVSEGGDISDGGAGGDPAPAVPAITQVTLRHAPRYRAFVFTGIAIGVIAALVLVTVIPVAGGASARTVFTYLALPLALFGGLGGAAVALLVERRH
jgi:hypothetical protein